MSKIGYIGLYRKIQDNFLWKEKRAFSKLEAWLDILMEVQHREQPQQVALGMTVLTCNYGQSLKSINTWAKRWNWSQNKVRRFFKMLKSCSMIVTENEQVTTRLTVCNYGKYDIKKNQSGAQTQRQRTTNGTASEHHRQTDNNDNNEKNEKNGLTPPVFSSSSKNKYKTFDQIDREEADRAFEIASRRFLANGKE